MIAARSIAGSGTPESLAKGRWLANLAVTVILVGTWFVCLSPQSLGGSTAYVLVTGSSMEPTLHHNDFVIARRQATYQPGEIVVYRIPEADGLVIHRIIGGSEEDGYILQGDDRTTPDLWRPRSSDVAGRLLFTIPMAGNLIPLLRSPLVVAMFAGYMAFLFVYLGGGPERSAARTCGQSRR
jgi:signal peptidase I